jgi:hypothetical protein
MHATTRTPSPPNTHTQHPPGRHRTDGLVRLVQLLLQAQQDAAHALLQAARREQLVRQLRAWRARGAVACGACVFMCMRVYACARSCACAHVCVCVC